MNQPPYNLDQIRRNVVLETIQEVCAHRGWSLLAAHVGSNHVHTVVEAEVPPEEMDKAMTNGAGWPMGPCALIDLIGIDVHVHASEALHDKLSEERMAPPERLVRMQQEGALGRKTGRGFYEY